MNVLDHRLDRSICAFRVAQDDDAASVTGKCGLHGCQDARRRGGIAGCDAHLLRIKQRENLVLIDERAAGETEQHEAYAAGQPDP